MQTRSRLESLAEAVRQHLDNGIIPFWVQRASDQEHGGYYTSFDEQGHRLPMPEKYLNSQARLLWWFSRLHRTRPDIPGTQEMASRGVDFLIKYFWDEERGGFYWKVNRDGSRLDDGKVVYGESFAIYALAEYSLATEDPRGLDYAIRTFDLLQKYSADTLRGGYFENLEPDWTIAPPGFAAGDRKGLDTHMHLMESFTTLYAASGEEIHKRKLIEVIDLICEKMIDPASGCGLNQFNPAFQSIPAIAIRRTWNAERVGEKPADPIDTTSYGHNVELSWLLRRAIETAGVDPAPYEPVMRRLLDHATTHGVDWEYGGIFRDGFRDGGPLVLDKEFWQQSEVLIGFLDGYQAFKDERYLEAFETIWRFVVAHMIIPGVGEWRILLDRVGNPIDANTGNAWKVSYHTGRSMIECSERLAKLIRSEKD